MGFTGSDMPDAGPAVLVHAGDQGRPTGAPTTFSPRC
jgi:hypothetical protein